MADGYKQKADELIDALKNEKLDEFIGFNYEGERRSKEYIDKLVEDNLKLKQLTEMLQTVKNN